MKAKKWLVIITFAITVLSLPAVFLCFFIFDFYDLWYDLWLTFFGGGILGFIMSLIEYFAEKRRAMETFYSESIKAAYALGKAKYFAPSEPLNLVVNCIKEKQANEWGKHFSKMLSDETNCIETTAKIELLSYILKDDIVEGKEIDRFYKKKIRQYVREINEHMDIFTNIGNFNMGDLSDSIGGLDFIFANRTIRKAAYLDVYAKIKNIRDECLDKTYHFQLYKKGEGNFAVCLDLMIDLSKNFFREEYVERDNGYSGTLVYKYMHDDLHKNIELFRAKIYNRKPDIRESKPISSRGGFQRQQIKTENAEK